MDLYTEYAKGVAMMNTINGEPAKTHPTNISDEGNSLVHAHITSSESKLPANATASLAAESCFAMNTLPSSRNTKLKQKKPNNTVTRKLSRSTLSASTLSISYQSSQFCATRNSKYIMEIITVMQKYVVLTYILPNALSPFANASANRFLNPFPNPMSNRYTHDNTEFSVSHIPYSYGLR